MSDLNLKTFDKLYPMIIHKYDELFDDQNANIMDRINTIVNYLNQVGKLTNDVVKDWNVVYQWVMNDGLTTDVNNKIEAMKANGELDTILQSVFNSIAGDKSTLHTTAKDTLVSAINEVDDLAKSNQTNIGDLTTLTTVDKDTIVHAINDNTTQLAQKATLTDTFSLNKEVEKQLSYLRNDGTFHVLGDSITAGYGLNYSDAYFSKFTALLNSLFEPVYDNDIVTNMWEEKSITLGGGYSGSGGNLGACSQSTILQVGNTITFTTSADYIDIIYHQQSGAGSIQVSNGGNLVKTWNCSGAENTNATTFPSATISGTNKTITLTCITAPVEILGIIRISGRDQRGNPYKFRHGKSGENTTFFTDTTRLNAIMNVDNFVSTKQKTYLLAIGTNDIYNSSKANSSTQYQTNLETIIETLLNQQAQVRIILTVPPIPVSASWPTILEPHSNYTKALYQLAGKYNCTVIDYSNADFITPNDYQDGLHPNPSGTDLMLDTIKRTIANQGIKQSLGSKSTFSLTLKNGFTVVNGEYGNIQGVSKNNRIELTGTLSVGTLTNGTEFADIPVGYAPKQTIITTVAGFDGSFNPYNILVRIVAGGQMYLLGNYTNVGYLCLDGISYDI